MNKVLSSKNNRIYLGIIAAYIIVCVFAYWDRVLDIMNTTVYAFSYKYGFMSRGVMGSLLMLYDSLTPFDAVSYNTIYLISELGTALLFLILIAWTILIITRCREDQVLSAQWMMAILIMITVPMFLGRDNFGRLDLYLMILTIICLMLIASDSCEFLIIPIVTLGALIHEGFVFMNLNIILVLLLYKCIVRTEPRTRAKYIVILALTFVLPSMVFLYAEFFSHNFGGEVYEECLALATKVSYNNDPHEEVLLHEILGADVRDMEWQHHLWNYEDTPVFLVLFSPFIVFLIYAFRRYVKSATDTKDRFISLIVLGGPVTLIPEIVLKVDYGRYVYAILFYYIAIFAVLLALGDNRVQDVASNLKDTISRHKLWGLIGIMYLFMFMPLRGYRICDVVTTITGYIYGN